MAEVVVVLESILALQQKADNALQPACVTIFPSNGKNSARPTVQDIVRFGPPTLTVLPLYPPQNASCKEVEGGSLKSVELFFGTIGGENQMLRQFDFNTISDATENFSEAFKITGYSYHYIPMYKGRLPDGHVKAIQELHPIHGIKRYMNEASILIELEHESLAQVLGYCIDGKGSFLVYDLAPYARLDRLICNPVCTLLDWNTRCRILRRVARVLLYLHKYAPIRIIHGDVTLENILLNEDLEPKLSGFGNAMAINETDCIIVDGVYGTLGYIAHEHMYGLRVSTKTDVYSFGVSVLETLSGCSCKKIYENTNVFELVSMNMDVRVCVINIRET